MTEAPARPFPWEKHYPEPVRWDIEVDERPAPAVLRDAAAQMPDVELFDWRGMRLTYAQFVKLVGQAASAFKAMGLKRGQCIALHLPNHVHHPVMFFGALAAGLRVAHLSPLDAILEIEHKLTDAEAQLLVTIDIPDLQAKAERALAEGYVPRLVVCDDARFGDAGLPKADAPADPRAMSLDAFLAGAATDALPPASEDPGIDDIALLQYTGGTTGLPKGAMLTHRNLMGAAAIFERWTESYPDLPEGERDVVLLLLPLFHIYALCVVLLRQVRSGGLIALRMRFDPQAVVDDIEKLRVTYFPGVPTMWTAIGALPDLAERDLSSLRAIGSGGAPQPNAVARTITEAIGIPLLGGWGMSETAAAGTSIPEWGLKHKLGTIGVPLPGIEMRVVDQDEPTRVLAPGEVGEIAVRGPNVTPGYWKREDANAREFAGGFFLTGDVGKMDEDGFFYLVDRKKDLIISGGFNVYPQAVEQALHEHPAIQEAAVVGIPDEYRGESAKAFVVLKAGAEAPSLEELHEFLADHLGRHELPRALELRDVLPKTAVGKLSRKDLRDEERAKYEAAQAADASA
ncbi:AMP-binding protein [Rhodovulum sp. DZ06]|uniref:AMP-binding protein n=1 Tax=Rhodovulum sp. DZ06 TaxID=3425126 RepID=UPI003D3475A5